MSRRLFVEDLFSRLAQVGSLEIGKARSFILACAFIIAWLMTGFWYGFSDPVYQLFINTTTTIATFLMMFLLQNTQSRDTQAIQLKLDELISSSTAAHNTMIGLEDMTEEQLRELKDKFAEIAANSP